MPQPPLIAAKIETETLPNDSISNDRLSTMTAYNDFVQRFAEQRVRDLDRIG